MHHRVPIQTVHIHEATVQVFNEPSSLVSSHTDSTHPWSDCPGIQCTIEFPYRQYTSMKRLSRYSMNHQVPIQTVHVHEATVQVFKEPSSSHTDSTHPWSDCPGIQRTIEFPYRQYTSMKRLSRYSKNHQVPIQTVHIHEATVQVFNEPSSSHTDSTRPWSDCPGIQWTIEFPYRQYTSLKRLSRYSMNHWVPIQTVHIHEATVQVFNAPSRLVQIVVRIPHVVLGGPNNLPIFIVRTVVGHLVMNLWENHVWWQSSSDSINTTAESEQRPSVIWPTCLGPFAAMILDGGYSCFVEIIHGIWPYFLSVNSLIQMSKNFATASPLKPCALVASGDLRLNFWWHLMNPNIPSLHAIS